MRMKYFNNRKINGLQLIEPKRTQKAKKVSLPINMEKKLAAAGWIRKPLGTVRSNHLIKNKEGFQLYIRRRNLDNFVAGFSKKPSNGGAANASTMQAGAMGSNGNIGNHKQLLTLAATSSCGTK